MGKLCLCGVILLIATVRDTKKLLFYDFLLFWKKIKDFGQLEGKCF